MQNEKVIYFCLCHYNCNDCNDTTNSNQSVTINETNITKIQIVKAMGNPELGANSKIFIDEEQVSTLISAINNTTIGEKVKSGDIGIGMILISTII